MDTTIDAHPSFLDDVGPGSRPFDIYEIKINKDLKKYQTKLDSDIITLACVNLQAKSS